MRRRIGIWVALMTAAWPVWGWYVRRMCDGSDEPWGIAALLTLVVIVAYKEIRGRVSPGSYNLPIAGLVLVLYAAVFGFVSPLPRAVLAMTATAIVVSRLYFNCAFNPGVWGLSMLSLPLLATLQFYLGYPLRVLVTMLTVPLLRMAGLAVVRQGAGLALGQMTVMVDAPCSGIRMLWVGGYLVCLLAVLWQLSARRTVLMGIAAIAVIIAANVVRAAALFYLEAGVVDLPGWAHQGVGLVMFAFSAGAIAWMMQWTCQNREVCA